MHAIHNYDLLEVKHHTAESIRGFTVKRLQPSTNPAQLLSKVPYCNALYGTIPVQ
jgi:hypothetical protein